MQTMKKIAIFLIATGKYHAFLINIVADLKKHFYPNDERQIFVFSDTPCLIEGTKWIDTEHRPFPYPTLMRYHFITKHKDLYADSDLYFYIDVDMRIANTVDNIDGNLIGTLHPGYYNKGIEAASLSFENNIESAAFIPNELRQNYYAGGFNGGAKYLDMAEAIVSMINIDAAKNYVAVWHDESYLNKYFALNPPDRILTPEYCYPENTENSDQYYPLREIKPRIIALNKNHKEVRA